MLTASRQNLLSIVRSDLGYVEERYGVTKFGERQGRAAMGRGWAAVAVVDWFERAGSTWLKAADDPYMVSSLVTHARYKGVYSNYVERAEPGDIVIYGRKGEQPSHCGIFEYHIDSRFVCGIEGCTISTTRAVQDKRQPAGVYRRIRSVGWARGVILMGHELDKDRQ